MGITFAIAVATKLAGPVLMVADGPPKYNVAPSCRAAAAINQAMDLAVSQDYQACMNEEEDARRELAQNWSKYTPQARARCVGQAEVGGMPSYVEVVECLQVTVDLNKLPSSDR